MKKTKIGVPDPRAENRVLGSPTPTKKTKVRIPDPALKTKFGVADPRVENKVCTSVSGQPTCRHSRVDSRRVTKMSRSDLSQKMGVTFL